MKKEKIIKIGILVLVIISIIAIFVFIRLSRTEIEEPVYFTPEPETWVETNRNSDNPDDYKVNIHRATRALSIFDINKQEYYYYGQRLVFFMHGFYKGNEFTSAYLDPNAENLMEGKTIDEQIRIAEENFLMKISPEMNPNDGIIDSFIIGKVEETKFVFYIFVDEDWRSQLEYTNIIWGDDYTDKSTLNVRQFDFSESTNGIYVDKIEYDIGWIKKDTNGGIMVGEITLDMIGKDEITSTFIYLR